MTPLKRLIASYILNWILWIIVGLIVERIYYNERQSWSHQILNALWLAFFTTILFNWKTINTLFKTDKSKEQFKDTK